MTQKITNTRSIYIIQKITIKLQKLLTTLAMNRFETGMYESKDFRLIIKYGIPAMSKNPHGVRSNTVRSKQLLNSGSVVLITLL